MPCCTLHCIKGRCAPDKSTQIKIWCKDNDVWTSYPPARKNGCPLTWHVLPSAMPSTPIQTALKIQRCSKRHFADNIRPMPLPKCCCVPRPLDTFNPGRCWGHPFDKGLPSTNSLELPLNHFAKTATTLRALCLRMHKHGTVPMLLMRGAPKCGANNSHMPLAASVADP